MILALYAMQTLPINYAGLLLILLGGILFVVELNTPTFGLLSTGGVVSILLGSLMLMDTDDPALQISRSVLFPTLATSVLVALGTLYLATKSSKLKPSSGAEGMVGATGVARDTLDPEGNVYVHGEIWRAVCDGTIAAGETVRVEKVDGLKLTVTKAIAPS